jgi:hypothetical protein
MSHEQYAVVDGTNDVVTRAVINGNDVWVVINHKKGAGYYYTCPTVKCRILKSGDIIKIEI